MGNPTQTVTIRVKPAQQGHQIQLSPWQIEVSRQDPQRNNILWDCDQPFSISLHSPGYFHNETAIDGIRIGTIVGSGSGRNYLADSGGIDPHTPLGRYEYTINVIPREDPHRRISIDPDYMVEDGNA